uniref:Uncharacterized protein n=1 Tax=viral metagenome TaxID=1070528 RepID=A0A6C0IQG3_9ZZZZ
MHVEGGLSKHEGAGIGERRTISSASAGDILGVVQLEHTTRDHSVVALSGGITSEGLDGVGKSINGVSVVERLSTKGLVEGSTALKRSTVIDVSIGLHNPDKLLTGVVEVELDLVGRRTDRLVTSELNLLDQILVGVLGHLAALIGIKEDVVHVQRGGNQRLLVGSRHRLGRTSGTSKVLDGPQALTDGAEIDVDLHLVVLQSNEGKSKSGVAAVPELKGHVKGGLGESVTGSAHLGRGGIGGTGTRHRGEVGVSDVGKLGGVTDHLVVTRLLLLGEGQLVPDVHPVTVLAIDALATNLNLHLGDELLADEIQPTGMHVTGGNVLVDLGESHLKVSAVSKITITGDGAGNATTEIGLSGEGLLDRLHSEVSVASVRHLPESDFRGSSKEHVLGAIGDKLHKSSSHFGLYIQL